MSSRTTTKETLLLLYEHACIVPPRASATPNSITVDRIQIQRCPNDQQIFHSLGVDMQGTIENELRGYLSTATAPSPSKDRNINMLMSFYGFGDLAWPTFEITARQFGHSKQYASQIKKQFMAPNPALSGMPALQSFLDILHEQRYWLHSDLETKITAAELVADKFSIRGLFNVFEALGVGLRHEIYTPDLKITSRSPINRFSEYFVLNRSDFGEAKALWQKVKKLPAKYGIAKLAYLDEALSTPFLGLVKSLLQYSDELWVTERDGELWYMFEESHNVLVNYSEKVFSIIDKCALEELAHTYHNALRFRTHSHPFPSFEIIAEYLNSSKKFKATDGLSYISSKRTPLNPIESDIVDFLQLKGTVSWQSLREYLTVKQYRMSSIEKNTWYSPLVYVDKSQGPSNYQYRLVGAAPVSFVDDNRYTQFQERLRRLGDMTDETVEKKQRREQHILREWLFDKKEWVACAICGEEHNVQALVAAHKKKRSECTTVERCDPYMVMPLCVFGCDFLYEHHYVTIEERIVRQGLPLPVSATERRALERVINHRVADEWLAGPDSYFWKQP